MPGKPSSSQPKQDDPTSKKTTSGAGRGRYITGELKYSPLKGQLLARFAQVVVNALTMSQERTFAIIKPDVVLLKKQGEVIQRILDEGFEILAMRQLQLSRTQVEGFYAVHKEQPFFPRLCDFITSGPVVILALEREDAVAHWRKVLGATDPLEAAPGTIRKLYGVRLGRNAGHGSDSVDNGLVECAYFFQGSDLLPPKRALDPAPSS